MNVLLLTPMLCDFTDVLYRCGAEIACMTVQEAVKIDFSGYDAFCVLGCGKRIDARVHQKLEEAAKSGKHVFVEATGSFYGIYSAEPVDTTRSRLIYVDPEDGSGIPGLATGDLLDDEAKSFVLAAMERLAAQRSDGFLFAVGDGNHSLATAKTCYQKWPNELNRYALCELVNLHDDSLVFEPIYRVVFGVDTSDILAAANKYLSEKFNLRILFISS